MPSLPPLLPDFHTLVRWDAVAVGPPINIGKARLKELRALGHKVDRFLAARAECLKQAARTDGRLLPPWMPTTEREPAELEGEGLFACAVRLDESGLRLSQPVLAQEMTARLARLWQRLDPAVPRTLPPALEMPADANAPVWLALLRLRPWREIWERELRRGTLESLIDALPRAWLLDPSPLPAGAVIPDLDLPSWQALTVMRPTGRRFAITPLDDIQNGGAMLDATLPIELWDIAIQQALESFADSPRVLLEIPGGKEDDATLVIAFYHKKAERVDGIGVMTLTPDADGRLVPASAPHA